MGYSDEERGGELYGVTLPTTSPSLLPRRLIYHLAPYKLGLTCIECIKRPTLTLVYPKVYMPYYRVTRDNRDWSAAQSEDAVEEGENLPSHTGVKETIRQKTPIL